MDILSIIQKKRDKLNLNENEINFFINAYTKTKEITDYQAAALLMAIYINGLNDAETYYLTKAMLNSGKTIDFEGIDDIIIDKHSTGGVGDKVSLILLPICVACGIKVAKISGKGLGHTGGTIDKLESIGVDTNLQGNEYLEILKKTGMFIMGQTKDLVPADKLLYDLRNATNTVNSLPLIAASIVSKKIALKTDYIFLDVKVGDGAFCSNYKQAMQLSKIMMNLFKKFKRNALIHITNMDQPLGKAIGNAIEIKNAIEFLKGNPADEKIKKLIEQFAIDILIETKKAKNETEALNKVHEVIKNGSALNAFKTWAIAQKADPNVLDSNFFLPKYSKEIRSKRDGYIKYQSTKEIGLIVFYLGAGRIKKSDDVDFQAGVMLNKIKNDFVKKGDLIATLYSSKPINDKTIKAFEDNIIYSNKEFQEYPIILSVFK